MPFVMTEIPMNKEKQSAWAALSGGTRSKKFQSTDDHVERILPLVLSTSLR
jgi:hypothetical protein